MKIAVRWKETVFALLGTILLPLAAYAQPMVIGERVEFTPAHPRAGETLTLTVHFRVEGGPVPVSTSLEIVSTPPLPPGPTAPTIILGTLDPGSHTTRLTYTIPDPAPSRLCFNVRGLIRDACLESRMTVTSTGRGERIVPTASPVAPPSPAGGVAEKPDLIPRVHYGTRTTSLLGIIPLSRERFVSNITVQNIGRGPAPRFDVRLECLIGGGWVPCAMCSDIDGLSPGQEATPRCGWPGGRRPSGIQEIKMVVDPGNRVDEANETNNSYVSH